jgi:hypothetical protein
MQIVILPLSEVFLVLCMDMTKFPAFWKQGLKEAEDIDFKYTYHELK